MKRVIIIFGCLLFLIMVGFSLTYGLFENDIDFTSEVSVAKFNLLVNNANLVTSDSFTIDNITTLDNDFVLEGKLAPNTSGYYTLELSSNGSNVDILYNITIDLSSIENKNIKLDKVLCNEEELTRTGASTYTGLFTLDETNNNVIKTIKIYITWDGNISDEEDSKYINGIEEGLPITIEGIQYLGEEITPYTEVLNENN